MDMKKFRDILGFMEEHHLETLKHMERTALYSLALAKRLNLDLAEREIVYLTGFLHDVGKICTPAEILDKKDNLNEFELKLVRNQIYYGTNILRTKKEFKQIADLIDASQENYDGTGFPGKLSGEEIPLIARIVHIADEYDVLRFGIRNMKHQDALLVLREFSGTKYDPELVEPFIRAVVKEGLLKLDIDLEIDF